MSDNDNQNSKPAEGEQAVPAADVEATTPAQASPAATAVPSAPRRTAKTLTNIVKEEIVIKRRKALSMIGYVIMLLTAIISGLIGSVSLMGVMGTNGQFNLGALINLVVFGGGAILMWFGKDYLKVEYEYSFTNGIVDIAQVINNRRRKELISFKTREVEIVAPIEDPKLHNIEQRQNIKKVKAVLNADSRIYFACFRKDDKQYLVYFEPSEEFLKCMRMYNERNVII